MIHDLVLGGTRGIGREVTRRLAREGHAVSRLARRPPFEADSALPNTQAWSVDLRGDQLLPVLDQVLARGPLGSLVCCQRYRGEGDDWEGELETSLAVTRTVIERLQGAFDPAGPRSIVLVSSVVGRFVAPEQSLAYHVAKAGLNQLARFFAVQLGPLGIRVNTVSPGVFTKEESEPYFRDHPEVVDRFARATPLRRMGRAADIADAVAFLCSPQAAFITGQDLVVDGGLSLLAHASLAQLP